MWVKICGITNDEDALMAFALGADAIGLNFVPGSKRQITAATGRDIVRRLPSEAITIGVFRDQDPGYISRTMLEVGLTGVQLHGHETPQLAGSIAPRPKILIMAFAGGSPAVDRYDEYRADAMLLDAATPGSGTVFDWNLIGDVPKNRRLILAGGLTPDNVGHAVERVQPWGVDAASGVESEPGQKDPILVSDFIANARAAEAPRYEGDVASGPFDWNESGDL